MPEILQLFLELRHKAVKTMAWLLMCSQDSGFHQHSQRQQLHNSGMALALSVASHLHHIVFHYEPRWINLLLKCQECYGIVLHSRQ